MRSSELSIRELELKVPPSASWHQDYKDSPFIFIGNIPEGITEGDLVIVFSQYGTPTHAHIVRPKKGSNFAYLSYEDQRSTILAVDNFDGTKLLDRTLRVDHARYDGETVPLEMIYGDSVQ